MPRRQSFYVEGFAHRNPIPAACRVGNVVTTGVIHGIDCETRIASESIDEQCVLMFGRLRAIIEKAGGTTDDIVRVTLWMNDKSLRTAVNRHWEDLFPDPASRPSRIAVKAELDDGMLVQCDFTAVLGD